METPSNIPPSRKAMVVKVVRALRHSTGLKALTLLLIASTPVSEAQPDENALSTSRTPRLSVTWTGGGEAACGEPLASLTKMVTIITNMLPTKT